MRLSICLTEQLANINGRIMAAGQSGQSPNSIFDLRDKAVSDLSKLTDLTVNYSGRGIVEVKLGSSGVGPTIVDGKQAVVAGLDKLIEECNPYFDLKVKMLQQIKSPPEWLAGSLTLTEPLQKHWMISIILLHL